MADTDLNNMAISTDAESVVDRIMEGNSKYFRNKADILMYAAGYMIKHHYHDFDPLSYMLSNSGGLNYSSSTFDTDGKWSQTIKALYQNTDSPYLILRALMDAGLLDIGKEIDAQDFDLFEEIYSD